MTYGWHDYAPFWKSAAAAKGFNVKHDPEGARESLMLDIDSWTQRHDVNETSVRNTLCQIRGEARWTDADRPYYDLYPSVIEAFTKVDLDKLDSLMITLPLPELMIRMPVGHELQASPRTKVYSLLACWQDKPHRGLLLSIDTGATFKSHKGQDVISHTVRGIRMTGGSLGEHLRTGPTYADVDGEAILTCARLVATLCLLKNDPDLIEPEPLAADRAKWEASHDPKLLEKAQRRGKRAWAVGKQIEVAPGFRRPHFAIRWMGKGRVDPRLRPIKGCLVRREKIMEVPTDYLGPELEPA